MGAGRGQYSSLRVNFCAVGEKHNSDTGAFSSWRGLVEPEKRYSQHERSTGTQSEKEKSVTITQNTPAVPHVRDSSSLHLHLS